MKLETKILRSSMNSVKSLMDNVSSVYNTVYMALFAQISS